jgi:hypothetical protein
MPRRDVRGAAHFIGDPLPSRFLARAHINNLKSISVSRLESRLGLDRLFLLRVQMWLRTPFRDIAIIHMRSLRSLPSREAGFVEPMECLAVAQLPDGPEWVYDVKLDGYRALAINASGKLSLYSRRRKSFNRQYPAVFDALLHRWTSIL